MHNTQKGGRKEIVCSKECWVELFSYLTTKKRFPLANLCLCQETKQFQYLTSNKWIQFEQMIQVCFYLLDASYTCKVRQNEYWETQGYYGFLVFPRNHDMYYSSKEMITMFPSSILFSSISLCLLLIYERKETKYLPNLIFSHLDDELCPLKRGSCKTSYKENKWLGSGGLFITSLMSYVP